MSVLLLSMAWGVSARSPTPLGIWEKASGARDPGAEAISYLRPSASERVRFDREMFESVMAGIATEAAGEMGEPLTEIRIPDPDGGWRRFLLIESPVMEPELAAKFPGIRSFRGISPEDPAANLRMSISHKGARIQVLSPNGTFYVEPYQLGDAEEHLSYYRAALDPQAVGFPQAPQQRALLQERTFPCTVLHPKEKHSGSFQQTTAFSSANRTGDSLRTLRLAIAATGEYTAFHGGTVADGIAALNDLVTRVTGIYEVEVSVRMTLVANNNLIVYTNAGTDPYGNDPLNDVQNDIDAKIGNANYDVGHVVSTGAGGVAFLGSVYVDGIKAGGYTGLNNPIGDPFWVDYVAHELGHQFGANHTFNNGSSGSCAGGNRNASTAYEPGSGSTIMAYAGICGSTNNLQNNSDPYFHSISLDEINAHLTSVGVPAGAPTGNTIPQNISAGPDLTIPVHTPFALTASATDPDGDTLTYTWEQRDLGPAQSLTDPDNGSSPLFRSFSPSLSPTRTFPRLSDLLANSTAKGERLPTLSRNMNFRVTVRDNRAGGGGVDKDDRVITVDSGSGPFEVTFPNTAVSLPSGSQTITWDVANTNLPPVNATGVSLLLSTDGGNTFPVTLVSNTANDGSETVSLPPVNTSSARIKVSADNHVFFDISDADFTIETPASPSLFIEDLLVAEGDSGSSTALVQVSLIPANPGQTVTVAYSTNDGSAVAGEDYQSTSGTVTFAPGVSSQSIPVTVFGDTDFEPDETFLLTLSTPANAILVDAQGTVTLENDEDPPPVFLSASSDTAIVGEAYSFQILASNNPLSYSLAGSLPAGLQFNSTTGLISGTPLAASSSTLTLGVSNATGSDTQSFTLQVVENVLSVAVDQAFLDFSTSGDADWFEQATTTYDGVDAVQSGNVGDDQSSLLTATVTGPEVISFRWKVSSEDTYDFLQFLVDGNVVRSISGEVDWVQTSASLGPGEHVIRWQYIKDGSVSNGSDAGWVDEVVLGSTSSIPLVASPPIAIGAQGQAFSLQLSATGDSTTFSASGLPSGLSINSSTGLISGTPTQIGDQEVTLTVSNASGSSNTSIRVQIGTLSAGLATALDQPTWTITTGGDLPFVTTTTGTHDGVDAAISGSIGDSEVSWMSVNVEGPGELRFWWRTSSEDTYDPLQWSVNGQIKGTVSGITSWTEVVYSLDPGTQLIEWRYTRDSFNEGTFDNLVWVDQVTFMPTLTPFETFMTTYPTPQDGLLDDADEDGLVNLLEYAFDLNPLIADSGSFPAIRVNVQGRLEVTFDRLRPELSYFVQGSDDLKTWSTQSILLSPQDGNTVLAVDNAPFGPTRSRFLRFEIISP